MNRARVLLGALSVWALCCPGYAAGSDDDGVSAPHIPSLCTLVREQIYAGFRAIPYSSRVTCVALYHSPELRKLKGAICGDLILCAFERKRGRP